eukprot:COSAG01_NODE_8746_length_2671_cov_1.407379_5_plen_90_part_00
MPWGKRAHLDEAPELRVGLAAEPAPALGVAAGVDPVHRPAGQLHQLQRAKTGVRPPAPGNRAAVSSTIYYEQYHEQYFPGGSPGGDKDL